MGLLSIRLRLIILYVVLNGIALGTLAYLAFGWYSAEQLRKLDAFLETEGAGVETSIGTYLRDNVPSPGELRSTIASADFSDYLRAYMRIRTDKPLVYKTTLAVFDGSGAVLAESNNALVLDPRILLSSGSAQQDVTMVDSGGFVMTLSHAGLKFRMIELPLTFDSLNAGSIRLACLLDTVATDSADFGRSTAYILAITFFVDLAGCIIIIFVSLRPVRLMSRTIDRINERNLHVRISELPGKDEISMLSKTFNNMLERIEGAYRFQEQLVDDLSHQLRTPLTSLRGNIDLALSRARTIEEYRNVMEDNISDVDRISAFINTMLSLAKLESRLTQLGLATMNLSVLLSNAIEDLDPLWQEKSISIEYSFQVRLASGTKTFTSRESLDSDALDTLNVVIDAFRVEQAITNILSNAYRYSPIGGVIHVNVVSHDEKHPDFCRIIIRNDGPPIAEKDLPHVFERFYQADTNRQKEGFGLGLAIAHKVVELHGGVIRAFNPPYGGAAFDMMLPRKTLQFGGAGD